MALNKNILACLVLLSVLGLALSQQAGYLPPNKGYDYEPPRIPFPDTNRPNKVPFPTTRPVTQKPYNPPPTQHTHDEHDHHHHHEPGMPFDFSYAVKEAEYGNDYSHNAVSDGDITRGEYRVQLPDGRLQIVKYTADWKNGFNAEVSYEGQAKYPDQPTGQASNPNQQYGAPPSGGYKY